MNLKKRIFKATFIVLLLCTWWSCSKESVEVLTDDVELANSEVNVMLNTVGIDPEAADFEKEVKSLHIYIFNKLGVLENKGDVKRDPSNINELGRIGKGWIVKEGAKDIYVIANASADLTALLDNSLNRKTFLGLVTTLNDWNNTDLKTGGVLMVGYTHETAAKPNTAASVTLYRRLARIDFNLKKKSTLLDDEVIIKSVTLTEQEQVGEVILRSYDGTANYADFSVKKPVTENFPTSDPTNPNYKGKLILDQFSSTTLASFYTYPRPALATGTKALRLTLTVDINGIESTRNVFINGAALNGGVGNDEKNPIAIVGNNVYKVNVTINKLDVDIDVEIGDWTNEDVDAPILGSDLWLSTRHVVMDRFINPSREVKVNYRAKESIQIIPDANCSDWLKVEDTTSGTSTTNGEITFTEIATSNNIPLERRKAKIIVQSGNIQQTIIVDWV